MDNISFQPMLLYFAAIFWTLGYDTIYGLQDIYDDEIIGIKSTSIKFKKNTKLFVSICYSLFISIVLILGFMMNLDKILFFTSIFFILSLIYQIKTFEIRYPNTCLRAFKINNLTGFLIFIFFYSLNIL